jgi:hypothetical protein
MARKFLCDPNSVKRLFGRIVEDVHADQPPVRLLSSISIVDALFRYPSCTLEHKRQSVNWHEAGDGASNFLTTTSCREASAPPLSQTSPLAAFQPLSFLGPRSRLPASHLASTPFPSHHLLPGSVDLGVTAAFRYPDPSHTVAPVVNCVTLLVSGASACKQLDREASICCCWHFCCRLPCSPL